MFSIPIYDVDNETVTVGQKYRFIYNVPFSIPAINIEETFGAKIKAGAKHFSIDKIYADTSNNQIIVETTVLHNPFPFVAVFGSLIGVAGVLWMLGISLDRIERVIDAPAVEFISLAVLIFIASSVGLFRWLK